MKSLYNLGGAAWAAPGGVRPFSLQPVPDTGAGGRFKYLTHILVFLRLDITTAVGGAVTVRDLFDFLNQINGTILGRNFVNISGWGLHQINALNAQMFGMPEPAAIGAGVANAIRTVRLMIPFEDMNGINPGEGAIPAQVLNEASQLNFTFGPAAIGTLGTVNAATLTLFAACEDRDNLVTPSLIQIAEADVERFSTLPGGVYSTLVAIAPAAAWAAADITALRIVGDDGEVYAGTPTEAALITAGALRFGSNYADVASWADGAANMQILPLIFPETTGRDPRSRWVSALRGLQLDIQGAAALIRMAYIRHEPSIRIKPDLMRAVGAADPSGIQVAPSGGRPGRGIPTPLLRRSFTGDLRVATVVRPEALGSLQGRIRFRAPAAQTSGALKRSRIAQAAASLAVAGSNLTAGAGSGAVAWPED